MIAIENQIRNLIYELSYYQKADLLRFLENMLYVPAKTNDLLQFAGAMELKEVEQIERVIEEGNKVDENR